MKIKKIKIQDIKPYENNARQITEHAINLVATSLQEFGWQQPIVTDVNYVVIAGHTRLLAAAKLNYKTAPVLVAEDLTPQQVKAYRLADNRTGQETTWDYDLLSMELGEFDIDLGDLSELTSFSIPEIERICARDDDGEEEQTKNSDLKTLSIRLPEKEIKEIKSWLDTIVEGHPSDALLRVARWSKIHGHEVD